MTTILFGASGYLGSHVAEQIHAAGKPVLCVLRTSSDATFLETQHIPVARADFDDIDALAALIGAGDTVVNCTADTRMHISDAERRLVEIDLPTRLFKAAEKAGAKRFMQLSTVMIYGFERPEHAIDETYPVKPKYSYSRIAQEREQNLLALQQDSALELVILRPSNTLGKRDTSALPALLASHEKGAFPVIGGGAWRYSCMDGRDVGRAMLHLIEVPVSKAEVFLVKAYDTSWLEVKAALDELLNRPTKLMNVPKGLAKCIGAVLEFVTPYGGNPALTRFSVDVVSTDTLFDDSKIRATGFEAKFDLRETLVDALSLTQN